MPCHVASLSRHLQNEEAFPPLLHQLHELRSSVLSLASNSEYIFSGSQNEDISVRGVILYRIRIMDVYQVWEKQIFTLKSTLRGHTRSVLALELAKEKDWLFSSSSECHASVSSFPLTRCRG